MNDQPKSEGTLDRNESMLCDTSAVSAAYSLGVPQKQGDPLQPTQRMANPVSAGPILLYPVRADRISTTSTADGKTIFKIAPAPGPAATVNPLPEKVSSSEFTYQSIVFLIEAIGRHWGLYGPRERSQLFLSVQKELESQGHALPVERIRRKWNNLIVTYKRVKDRIQETGHARTSWEYFEMMDAMLGNTIGAQSASSAAPKLTMVTVATETTAPAPLSPVETKPVLLPAGGIAPDRPQAPHLAPSSHPQAPRLTPIAAETPSRDARRPFPSLPSPPAAPAPLRALRRLKRLKPRGIPPLPCPVPRLSDTVASAQAEERAGLLRELAGRLEERARRDEERHGRAEARARRHGRREARCADALGRMAAALEQVSAKQGAVITLLQRLTDGK